MLIEKLNLLTIAFFLSIIAHWVAWVKGYFKPLSTKWDTGQLHFFPRFLTFIVFMLLYALLPSLILQWLNHSKLASYAHTFPYVASAASMCLLAVILTFLFTAVEGLGNWKKKWKKNIKLAIGSYLIILPTLGFISEILVLLNRLIFQRSGAEQTAVTHIKNATQSPFTITISVIAVALFAPIIEEILFRGLLHRAIRRYSTFWPAATLSSLCFSFVHFSPHQGIGNIPLLVSLFIFSYYLTYLYERQRSIIPAIILHGIFNLISAIRIMVN